MPYEVDGLDLTFIAGETMTSSQYLWVYLSADNTVKVCSAGTETPIGVLQNEPSDGGQARVRVYGVSRVINGTAGAIAYGTLAYTDSDGKVIAQSADKGIYNGIVLYGATTQNYYATVFICGPTTLSTT